MSVLAQKLTLRLCRSILIISLLGLTFNPLPAFQQSTTQKTKYEFTDTRISEADTLLKERKYQKALEAYQKAYDTYEQENFYEGMVYAMERMGLTHRRLRQNDLSAKVYQQSSTIAKKYLSAGNLLISKVYANNGTRAHFRNDWVEASHLMDSAKWAYDQSKNYDSTLLKTIIDFKFYTYYFSGLGNDTLIKYLNERSRFFEKNGSTIQENIYLLADYNRAYYRIGDYEKSVAYGLEAVKQSEMGGEIVEPFYFTDATFNLGRSLYAQKKYDRVLKVSNDLIAYTLKKTPNTRSLPGYYNLRAVTLIQLGRYKEAASQFRQILKILESKGQDDEFYIDIIMNLGVCYQRMGEYKPAEDYLFKALKLQKETTNELNVKLASRYKYLGQYYAAIEKHGLATQYYDSAIRSGISSYVEGVLQFPRDLNLNLSYEMLITLKDKQRNLAELSFRKGNDSLELLDATLAYGEGTHRYLLTNREKLRASEGRLFLSENFKDLYEVALNACYEKYLKNPDDLSNLKKAWEFLSYSKANLFLEQSGELAQIQDSRLDLQTKNMYYKLQSRIDSLEQNFYRLINEITTSEDIRNINTDLLNLGNQMEHFKDSLSQIFSKAGETSIPAYESIRLKLKNETDRGIIEFFIGEQHSFVIGMTEKKSFFKRLEYNAQFDHSFQEVIHALSNRPEIKSYQERLSNYDKAASNIYQYLLKELLDDFGGGISKLTIIPDDKLSKLPFGALVYEPNPDANYFSELDYMLNKYVINYALSTSELNEQPSKKLANKGLLGIGYSGDFSSETRSGYGALAGTEDEILYLKERIRGEYLLGQEGTKREFIDNAKFYDVLHLAIHGEADSLDRYQSSLIFNGVNDNILKTSDLYVAGLQARLAVLSACESGIGEINKGEGTFSIARGFALVGVPSIVMSLWKVNDKEASKLMSSMYSNLLNGESIDFALTNAKRDYLVNSEQYTSHPYYWSAFVSLGEEVEVLKPDRMHKASLVIILFVALLFGLLLLFRYKKRKGA